MRETLKTFFERTAHSRDANGFLDQYHRVEADRFLLLIPKLKTQTQVDVFLDEVKYLIKLELYPTLLFCDEFLEAEFKIYLVEQLCCAIPKLSFIECAYVNLVPLLKKDAEKRAFSKYMLVDQPMMNKRGELINLLHLNMTMPSLDQKSSSALDWLSPFLEHMGPAFSMQMVEADRILEELFTKRGAGTLISLGYEFNLYDIHEVDQKRLIELLESGFMRKLKPDYMKHLLKNGASVLLEKDYRGAIIITHIGDLHYLNKVVVAPEFFGRGMGSLLLDELTEHLEQYSRKHPKLIWRAKPENPFLPRYASLVYEFAKKFPGRCGTLSDGNYVYHFIGLNLEDREQAFKYMQDYPGSFRS